MTATDRTPLVWFNSTSLGYRKRSVLVGVNFEIFPGDWVYIVGRTGSGKSTLLRSLYGDCEVQSGRLTFEDQEVANLPEDQLALLRRRIGVVFQDFQLLPDLTVAGNVQFVMKATGWRDKLAQQQRLQEVLIKVGLAGKQDQYPHELSGGEQQRVAIARALVNGPRLLIADEPTGNLDPIVADEIMDIFKRIHQEGAAVVIATHDYRLLSKVPGKVIELDVGQLVTYPEPSMFLRKWSGISSFIS